MYKICQTEQSYRRQREIERGLLRLMLRKNYEDGKEYRRKSIFRHLSVLQMLLCAVAEKSAVLRFAERIVPMDDAAKGSGNFVRCRTYLFQIQPVPLF